MRIYHITTDQEFINREYKEFVFALTGVGEFELHAKPDRLTYYSEISDEQVKSGADLIDTEAYKKFFSKYREIGLPLHQCLIDDKFTQSALLAIADHINKNDDTGKAIELLMEFKAEAALEKGFEAVMLSGNGLLVIKNNLEWRKQ